MPERISDSEVRARAFWSGTITFGLVSIPVNLFPANRAGGVSFRMVDEDGTPLSRVYFCPREDKPIDWDEIVRGYELDDGEYVEVTDEELEALEPRKSRDIDLRRFVPAEQIEPLYFERGYYLTPGGESTKAYMLLTETMERAGRAGIATFVMRGKEYLTAIFADHGILRAETLRFVDEIRSPQDVGLPERPKLKPADVKKMEAAIKAHTSAKLAPAELQDEYAQRVLELVKKKERKDEDVVPAPAEPTDEEEVSVIDLMEVLKRSLEGGGAGRKTRKAARKRKTA